MTSKRDKKIIDSIPSKPISDLIKSDQEIEGRTRSSLEDESFSPDSLSGQGEGRTSDRLPSDYYVKPKIPLGEDVDLRYIPESLVFKLLENNEDFVLYSNSFFLILGVIVDRFIDIALESFKFSSLNITILAFLFLFCLFVCLRMKKFRTRVNDAKVEINKYFPEGKKR